MTSILTDAQLAQRDASRRLYFVAAGCLYHPQAHLVLDDDETARVALEQSVDAALQFAELSGTEAQALKERAIAATEVVLQPNGTCAFKQPERKPRRRWQKRGLLRRFASASPDMVAPPERRPDMRWRTLFLRLLGILAAAAFLLWGARVACQALVAIDAAGPAPAAVATGVVGVVIGIFGAVLLVRLVRPLLADTDGR